MLTVAVAVTVASENVIKFNISLLYNRLGIIIGNNIYKLDQGKLIEYMYLSISFYWVFLQNINKLTLLTKQQCINDCDIVLLYKVTCNWYCIFAYLNHTNSSDYKATH